MIVLIYTVLGMQDPAAACVYLVCSEVDDCQLALVIQHLLKVGNMPELVSGVAVKSLHIGKGITTYACTSCLM